MSGERAPVVDGPFREVVLPVVVRDQPDDLPRTASGSPNLGRGSPTTAVGAEPIGVVVARD